ncbi:MAG: hypothetical protein E7305_10560 [Butyrivibrio sp.]|nr:hypothetical protein [Butyrivibrio sp.]
MEEYIKKLLEQVRFKKAHKSIEGEIRSHIEEQINDNISAGMDRADAEKAAVEDMGDPVEVGISMDGVHRPQIAWNVVALAVIIGIMSIFVHEFMIKDAAINDAAVSSVIIIGCMASVKSKNQLGLVMGAGCMNVLLVNMLINVLENLGVIPFADSFMPFFSAGGSNIVLAYIFLGIILSIYKYKDAYPQHLDIGIRVKLKNLEL